MADFLRVALLADYNTKVVVMGTIVYSIGCAIIGVFLLLQRRSMLTDVLSHAALPGTVGAFMILTVGGQGTLSRNLPLLLFGAFVAVFFAVVSLFVLRRYTILKNDAIFGILLSVFFGFGVVLLGISQRLPGAHTAGLMTFLYGNTAAMILSDAYLFMISSLGIVIFVVLLYKELSIMCFDSSYASTVGIPTKTVDFLILVVVMIQTIMGIQAVGVVLVGALIIIPAVSARFWTHTLSKMILISVAMSIISGYLGAVMSAVFTDVPAGAVIVCVAELLFIVSLFVGTEKGVLRHYAVRHFHRLHVEREHLLRRVYEYTERKGNNDKDAHAFLREIHEICGLSYNRVRKVARRLQRKGYLYLVSDAVYLSEKGTYHAREIVRRHRLWELYFLMHTGDTSSVDIGADAVEHVLAEDVVFLLEKELEKRYPDLVEKIPRSIHPVEFYVQEEESNGLAHR